MSISENFIPHETMICNGNDPPWMNKQIKALIAGKTAFYKRLKRRMLNSKLIDKLDALQAKLQNSFNFFQFEYYRKISKKSSNLSTKCYSTLLEKSPVCRHFFMIISLITDFKKKERNL